jgi:hypothetical protein
MDLRTELIEFLDSIREYVRESGTNIADDERESIEFVDLHLQKKMIQHDVVKSVCNHNWVGLNQIHSYCTKCKITVED